MQKLVMPLERCRFLCGYKTQKYFETHGYAHYGIDISSIQGGDLGDHVVRSSGSGRVVAAGWDNSGGNIVVLIYTDVHNHKTGEVRDLVARYMHLSSVSVKAGDTVSQGTVLGVEGMSATTSYHLHLEFETDTQWPLYSPQVASRDDALTQAQGNILLKGVTDTTVNPSDILYCGPDQEIVASTYAPEWRNPEDDAIPQLEDDANSKETISRLQKELEQERRRREIAEEAQAKAEKELAEIKSKIRELCEMLEE